MPSHFLEKSWKKLHRHIRAKHKNHEKRKKNGQELHNHLNEYVFLFSVFTALAILMKSMNLSILCEAIWKHLYVIDYSVFL